MNLDAQTVTNLLLAAVLIVLVAMAVAAAAAAIQRQTERRASARTPRTPRQYRQAGADELDRLRARLDQEPPVALSASDRAAFRGYADADADKIRGEREQSERDIDLPHDDEGTSR